VPAFYHRTTEAAWEEVQDEGVLWGKPDRLRIKGTVPWREGDRRFTYLSPYDMGSGYGPVLLMVEYSPAGQPQDNYGFDPPPGQVCWQFCVFVPIPLDQVTQVKPESLRCGNLGDTGVP